jgi:hypothetical protein
VQYALKYIAACWDGDLVGNILGAPYKPRRAPGAGSTAIESVTVLSILLPDRAEAPKPALASATTVKHALAALTSLVQVRCSQLALHVELPATRPRCSADALC